MSNNNLKLFHTVLNTTQNTTTLIKNDPIPIPQHWDGLKEWKNFLGDILNQGECSACYAFATTSALQDRYRLFTNNEIRPTLNPLEALVCHPIELTKLEHRLLQFDIDFQKQSEQNTQFKACDGGSLTEIAQYFYRLGAVETTCVSINGIQNYIDRTNHLPICNQLTANKFACGDKQKVKRYWPIEDFYITSVSDDLKEIAVQMQQDISQNGPLVAGFRVYPDFIENYDGKSIYIPKQEQSYIFGHAIKIIGFGTEIQNGQSIDYWQCVNSWGIDWGDRGVFKIQRANPMLEIEYNHIAFIPQIPGILQHFNLIERKSDITMFDKNIRRTSNVNPFTLLTMNGTEYCKLNQIPITLVFHKLSYPSFFEPSNSVSSSTITWIVFVILNILAMITLIVIVTKKKLK